MVKVLFSIIFLLLSLSSAHATLINSSAISSDHYITFDKDSDGVFDFDIVWVSSTGHQFTGCDINKPVKESGQSDAEYASVLTAFYSEVNSEYDTEPCSNQLLAPSHIAESEGMEWNFIEDVANLTLLDVANLLSNSTFVNELTTGNFITGFDYFNTNQSLSAFKDRDVKSDWTDFTPAGPFGNNPTYNIFYAREHVVAFVSEPSTIAIFMILFFAQCRRIRKK